jgi:2-methylcitrate dehydratase
MKASANGRTGQHQPPSVAQQIAAFTVRSTFGHLSAEALHRLKACLLDALGCALSSLGSGPMPAIREQLLDFGGGKHCTLIGGERSAPDRAAFYNSALVRYVDFSDSYLGKAGTCHPSDNLGAVLAAAEYAGRTGREFLTALAVAYQVQCRLTECLGVMRKGFDHCTLLSYAVAAGVSRVLGLNEEQTANAIGISGDSALALTVTRSHPMSNWKGLAAPQTASTALHTTFLALRGITGPLLVFEGPKGLFDAIHEKADINWAGEDLEAVTQTTLKQYNAEVHTQSVIDATLTLKRKHGIAGKDVAEVRVDVFRVAYEITGGGDWGERITVRNKEEADHSLPYLVAVALLDGQVLPVQFTPERIQSEEVQKLLRRVTVSPRYSYTRHYPEEMRCKVTVKLQDGRQLVAENRDFEGFKTRPLPWEKVVAKFEMLSEPWTTPSLRRKLISTVEELEHRNVEDLLRLLSHAKLGERRKRLQAKPKRQPVPA